MSLASTPYEGQRRRLRFLEMDVALRENVKPAYARRLVARALHLSPEQVRNIQRGRAKDLGLGIAARIDRVFLALAERAKQDLAHEMVMATHGAGGVDPGVVADAKTTKGALEDLILEAEWSCDAEWSCGVGGGELRRGGAP